jgi:HD-GYP domain-containing protein (c-di-GMP phosphodiesterase class II)
MTPDRRRDLRFRMFAVAVLLLAVGLAPLAWAHNPVKTDLALPLLLVAVLVSEVLPVSLPGGGSVALSYPLTVAAIVYLGPGYAALIALASGVPILLERPRPPWEKSVFNVGQVVAATMVSAMAYVALGGRFLVAARVGDAGDLGHMLLPLTVVATLGMVLNFLLVGVGRHMLYGESARDVWSQAFSWMFVSQVVLGFVGVAIAELIATVGAAGFALFVVPLLVARQTYSQSVGLRDAYADTISSLVAAIEAKDVYTRGHSERVAAYSVKIARAMEFSEAAVRRIEYAALLHDVGKVGVSHRVLAKPSKLTDAEYDEIKRHPEIAAHILADVPYLADLVPIVAAHHERLDGLGYGEGLSGEAVPLQARILAVADSYDAMTSVRSYRQAMTHEAAMSELRGGTGTQFDARVVEAFEVAYEGRIDTEGISFGVLEAAIEA